jgi:DNA-directed RNA polymerase
MGSDIARGLLIFSKGKKLGNNGLNWLKIQISNLMGNDKVSLTERIEFTNSKLDLVYDSVKDPFGGSRWWLEADDPWQCIGTCNELVRAIDSGNPEEYVSQLPLRQDGTCNGLQHYAALGGDFRGAQSVNVLPSPIPRDVYSDVLDLVKKRVEADSRNGVEIAKLLIDKLQRKIIKQTVMTSVYGVTFIGAKTQISEALKEKCPELTNEENMEASKYLALKTFDSIREMFTGAKKIMDWLSDCSSSIAASNKNVSWITPLGLPVTQPYSQDKGSMRTVETVWYEKKELSKSEDLVNQRKHRTAFPPNFVHSLDSSHMMLTALACHGMGLEFSSVHDSYWTHACDVERMNITLREQFITLYSRPILHQLRDHWVSTYPSIKIPPVPNIGTLSLEQVRKSTYFFS